MKSNRFELGALRPIVAAVVLLFVLGGCSATSRAPNASEVVVYSGPNMRASMETLGRLFEERHGVRVTVVSDDVRPLIARIKREAADHQAIPDLVITHDPFLQMLIREGIAVREAWVPASLTPVIVVRKGNPKDIHGLRDFARPGLRVGLTDAEQTISGEIIRVMLRRAGIEGSVQGNVVVRTPQGRDLCKALIAGQCDVGIVWNAVVAGNREHVAAVPIEPEYHPQRNADSIVQSPTLGRLELDYVRVTLALLERSQNPSDARRFAELATSSEGAAIFASNGFSPAAPGRPALPLD